MPISVITRVYIALFVLCSFHINVMAEDRLRDSLTFFASFDNGTDADFALGDPAVFTRVSKNPEEIVKGLRTDFTSLAENEGRSGHGLRFTKREAPWIFYLADKNIQYVELSWSGTVSFWLKLDPDQDLAPGYTDPIQITPRGYNDARGCGSISTRAHRDQFRLGAFPDLTVWNPDKRDVPESERPLIPVLKASV